VFGFLLKMQKENVLENLFTNYTKVFVLIFFLVIFYIMLFYLLSANFNLKKALEYFKEMLPAGITAFSTMSSVATMPVTLNATEKNISSKKMANLIVPTTVNVHLMADGLSISITALALMIMGNQGIPEISSYIWFVVYYCIAKFSCAGVPGGGVIVLIPVFQEHLHMNLEIATLLTTIYILQDSFLTCGNVMGNGAFAIFANKFLKKIKLSKD
jgi:Na+/H+-dicarboxylate symporter